MANPLGDRNLLFGILAVERSIIGPDALVTALKEWVTAKSKGMAQILREQNAINENQHAVLEECVDVHMSRHGNDAYKSLAAVCLAGAAREQVAGIDDADLQAGLAHVARAPLPTPAPAPEAVVEVEEVAPAQAPQPLRKEARRPRPAKSGVPGCVWLAAGLAVGLLVAVVVLGGGLVAVLWMLNTRLEDQRNGAPIARDEPIVQVKRDAEKEAEQPAPAPIKEAPEPKKEPVADPPDPPAAKPKEEPKKVQPEPMVPVVVGPPEGFVPLFNGKDLSGWKQHPLFGGEWRVEDGVLSGVAGERNYGQLETEKPQPRNFHLRVEARVMGKGFGHVTFRSPAGSRIGYDVPLSGFTDENVRAGGVILQGPARRTFPWTPPARIARGQWFVLEVIVEGNHIIAKVDGKVTTDIVDQTLAEAGHIALGQQTNEPVQFRRIDIKALAGGVVRPVEPIAATPGFVPLFNGRDLAGWHAHKITPGNWRVENGILIGDAPGKFGGRLYTDRAQSADFHLRVEARISDKGSGAVLCRCQDNTILGYEAAINSTAPYYDKTGSLAAQVPGRRVSLVRVDDTLVPAGQWFTMDIIGEGKRITVKVNGKTTVSVVENNHAPAPGHIVLMQNLRSTIEFRKVEIKHLAPVEVAAPMPPPALDPAPFPVDAGFVPLFNGKDLAGWKSAQGQPRDWQVRNGILTGMGGHLNMLYTTRDDYTDFHLRAEARINNDGLSALLFRYRYGAADLDKSRMAGYGVRLNGRNEIGRTGSLMAFESFGMRQMVPKEPLAQPGQWFNLEIIARGDHVITKVNGKAAVNFHNPKTDLKAGRIVLEASATNRNTVVEYRKIEIKALQPVAVVPKPPVANGPWVALFNGNDMNGWRVEGNKTFRVAKEGARGVLAGNGPDAAIVTNRKDFNEFTLRVELSCAADTEAYFALKQHADGNGTWRGLTSRITGDAKTIRAGYAGIDAFKNESGNQRIQVMPGEPFTLEFRVKRDGIRILGNDRMTGGINFAPDRFAPGAIGLFVARGGVTIRKIEVREDKDQAIAAPPMPPPGNDGFAKLFNGRDLTGWQAHPKRPGNWRVENGVLIGSAPAGGSLYSTRGDFRDFHLRAKVRINDRGFGRVYVRAAYDPANPPLRIIGYETLINQRPVGDKLGTLRSVGVRSTATTAAADAQTRPGDWIMLDFVAKGDRVTVSINGKVVADFTDEKGEGARQGHIVLRQDANAMIEFRNVEVRDLSDAQAGGAKTP